MRSSVTLEKFFVNAETVVVAGRRARNRELFGSWSKEPKRRWLFAGSEEELLELLDRERDVKRIFFLHWSQIVPDSITRNYECINFHMTDLPYGRGGSPLQNLILAGHEHTKVSAFRMNETLDGGPIYLKRDLSLSGSAEEILSRCTLISLEMVNQIVSEDLEPTPQFGEVVMFRRRAPEQSELPPGGSAVELFNFIRMLDAEDYPRAFLRRGNQVLVFRNAKLSEGILTSEVEFLEGGIS